MAKRSAADLWKSLEEATMEVELEDALAMPAEDRRRELAEAGVDVDRALDEANARVRAAAWRTAQERSKRARRLVASLAVGASLAASVAVVLGVFDKTPNREMLGAAPSDSATSPEDPSARAASLRRAATAACKAKRWSMCRARLDEAAQIDPAGDKDPAVEEMRRSAVRPP
ncbi:MAG TPA: hypothetical protein VGM06_14470 [Polyangiaceae bacterium]|jgi:hypothetical protein